MTNVEISVRFRWETSLYPSTEGSPREVGAHHFANKVLVGSLGPIGHSSSMREDEPVEVDFTFFDTGF